MEVKISNMLYAKEKYIVHQCNCMSRNAAGLALAIFKKFPWAEAYSYRVHKNSNDFPGNIKIFGGEKGQRLVISMFAQLYPGKPIPSGKDTIELRKTYFEECLCKILKIIDLDSIAFPWKIGCGLAGGKWEDYYKMIEDFSKKTSANVIIYRQDELSS